MTAATETKRPRPWQVRAEKADARDIPAGAIHTARQKVEALERGDVNMNQVAHHLERLFETQEIQNVGKAKAILDGFIAQQQGAIDNPELWKKTGEPVFPAAQCAAMIEGANIFITTIERAIEKEGVAAVGAA